jgi:hypothetical protein
MTEKNPKRNKIKIRKKNANLVENYTLDMTSEVTRAVNCYEADRLVRRHFADCSSPGFRQLGRETRWAVLRNIVKEAENLSHKIK